MGEYSREQRNQLGRAIANNVTGSKQLKGFVDNRIYKAGVLQKKNNMLTGVKQLIFDEKKKNNTSAVRAAMKGHRKNDGNWSFTGCKKNYALNISNHTQFDTSDEGGHAERNLFLSIAPGINRGDSVQIHTERETCPSCYNKLKEVHDEFQPTKPFDLYISYSVEYPGDLKDSQRRLYDYYKNNRDTSDIP